MGAIAHVLDGAPDKRATFRKAVSSLKEPASWLWDWFGGPESDSGVRVTPASSLWHTGVYAAVRILSESVAQLPLGVFQSTAGGGSNKVTEHNLSTQLATMPNNETTSFDWRENLQAHLASWGNAYVRVVRTLRGEVTELITLRPDRTRAVREDGRILYKHRLDSGEVETFRGPEGPRERPTEIMHIHGLGFDGLSGYTPVRLSANSIGLGIALEQYAARFFRNNARPGGLIKHPEKLSDEARENLVTTFESYHKGLEHSHKIGVLEEGMDWVSIGAKPGEAQFVEARKFQLEEIARLYRIPPHMLADLERATFSNIEEQGLNFVIHTLMPWLVRWEMAMLAHLFLPAERERGLFAHFNVDGFLRGDSEKRNKAFNTARMGGWMNADEIRAKDDQAPLADGLGKVYIVPLNMTTLDQLVDDGAGNGSSRLGKLGGRPPDDGDGEGADPDQRLLRRGAMFLGRRELRSSQGRERLRVAHLRIFQDAASRLMKRETRQVRRLMRAHLEKRSAATLDQALQDFYAAHPATVDRIMLPSVQTLGEAIAELAATEIGITVEDVDTAQLQDFLRTYSEHLGQRTADASLGQLQAMIADTDPVILTAAMEERLLDWEGPLEEHRPGQMAARETVQSSNATTRLVWLSAGVAALVWTLTGGKSCPLCFSMKGKRVKGQKSFLDKGDMVKGKGVSPLKMRHGIKHPPLHKGCDCTISAGR